MRAVVVGLLGGAVFFLAACGQSGAGKPSPTSSPSALSAGDKAALASLPADYRRADLANGEERFSLCLSCHSVIEGAPDMTGPNLHGVFGRRAGAKPGYAFSNALTAKGIVWTADTLNAWLTGPQAYVPGTKMSYPGVRDPLDRRDLIAYLRLLSVR